MMDMDNGNLFDEDLSDADLSDADDESIQLERYRRADSRAGACPSFFGREEY